MNYDELFNKYQALLEEIAQLRLENESLKRQLKVEKEHDIDKVINVMETSTVIQSETSDIISNLSTPDKKVQLFMSLFKGRSDVYARRWGNKKGVSGYSPFCLNEWKTGVCNKPKIKCSECSQRRFGTLTGKIIEDHLRGKVTVGIYPLLQDETCCFLAIDFDDEGWREDISVLREICIEFNIPVAVERSRSGNGAHAWLFFEEPITAALARRFGTSLLTASMNKRHEITFKSYDRLFPNQDFMPKGGMGNLIALPLQMLPRKSDNSVFIDENFNTYDDQWGFLNGIKKLSLKRVESLTEKLSFGNDLGVLKKGEEETIRPWESKRISLLKDDFPDDIELVKANMLYIPKKGISERALNMIKRLAAFKNPQFYKNQAMRMPTYNIPRVISCSDETNDYLCLPRGLEAEVESVLKELRVKTVWVDERNHGRDIRVEFDGTLRSEQEPAVTELLKHDNGVLAATTAFGKTVVAANIIAKRKVNTLILVHTKQLQFQWIERLSTFLNIYEELPLLEKKRGRKKKQSIIGQMGSGKNMLGGIIDVAIMQSVNSKGKVQDFVKDYGMVIVDECHHISAFTFENILKLVNAKYVYGLSATPARQDGHDPIIYMQCGPVRYKVDAKKQAEERPFEHYVIPRFTSFRVPVDKDSRELSIQELYGEISSNELRNELIINDVKENFKRGRNSLILTERTAHVELLSKRLSEEIPEVISLTGGMGAKETRRALEQISAATRETPLTLVATGKYVGEGFDEARLDTLFLAMPISWKGRLQQYAGRLHRLHDGKNEVQVYDYVDIHVSMLEKMYNKRLSGYSAIGYKAKGEGITKASADIIFDRNSFQPVYSSDITDAVKEVLIVSPFVTKRRAAQMLQYLSAAVTKNVKVTVITRPTEDFKEKDKIVIQQALESLEKAEIRILFKSKIHQKFAVIDNRIVWYGSINLLSFGSAEESIMRLESLNIAGELLRSLKI